MKSIPVPSGGVRPNSSTSMMLPGAKVLASGKKDSVMKMKAPVASCSKKLWKGGLFVLSRRFAGDLLDAPEALGAGSRGRPGARPPAALPRGGMHGTAVWRNNGAQTGSPEYVDKKGAH